VPAEEAPDGTAADEPVVVRAWDPPGRAPLGRKDHAELGEGLGVLDPGRAAKLSGARFAVTRGAGARLERALVSFLLDRHTAAGYVEHGLPHLVTPETMTGTGQLPKFAEDLFHTAVADRELLLIPTAEVPLVNLYRGESLDPAALPIAVTARTPCYRAEAGSYGRDTRGLIRVHQFEKVELVRLCRPQDAGAELERLTADAAGCLEALGLAYRVIDLRAGDLGFTARRTFDLEVWLPGQDAYREISSCSDCGDFQARRAGIRLRGGGFPHTLNGSALPIGRTLAAILEQYQRPDGSVEVPAALVPYCGQAEITSA
jgi:seryl-tRNA synthetase